MAQHLRERFGDIPAHPLEPANSPTLRTGKKLGRHRIQGISDEFVPSIVKLGELGRILDIWDGDAIIWADGTRSHSSPHPSVVIGNKSSFTIGPGVFVGQGKGVRPLDDPNKTRCVTLDEVPYCY